MSLGIVRRVMERGNYVVLDTETTGLDFHDQVVQIAILDSSGTPLLDTLIKPTRPISYDAVKVHGITNQMVSEAPGLPQIVDLIHALIRDREVIAYNVSFDLKMLYQSSAAHGLTHEWRTMARSWACAMLAYAEFYGERNRYGFKWQSLANACIQQGIGEAQDHQALADCRLTLQLLHRMRGQVLENE